MLGHHPGMGQHQNFPPHVFNEQTWLLAKYTSLSGSPKVNVEGNVRAVFSAHRRQLTVWNENRMLICIDLHYAKTTIPTKECYAIVKENNVSLCRLKFRSLPERVSFGAALADMVHVANDRSASQDVSSQGWQGNHGTPQAQSEFNLSQGKAESGTVIEHELECLPQPSRVSTPLSGIQISPSDSSPWRCYFNKNAISPIPRSTNLESTFKKPVLYRSTNEKNNVHEDNDENYLPEEVMGSASPIGDVPLGESSASNRLNESIELFNDDHSRSLCDIGETIALNGDKMEMKREDSVILFEDDQENEDIMNWAENETERKVEKDERGRMIDDEKEETEDGEWGMTHSFIARLREIPNEKKKLKDGDVIRVKEDRAKMHGQECPCCREYYDALGLDEKERIARVDNISRHRFVSRPMPETPPHYWEIDFPSEDEQRKRGFLKNH